MCIRIRLLSMLVACGAAVACAQSPVTPSGPVTLTTASLTSPANGAAIPNLSQPVTLTIANAQVASSDPVTYTFEVASDVTFGTKVVTQDVTQGTGGTTSLKLNTLPAGADYYWRTRTAAGGTVGVYTSPMKFSIGTAISVSAPAPSSPANGAVNLGQKPTLTVTNAARTGPVTTMTYRFEISKVSTFSTIFQSASVNEGTTTTSWTPTTNLDGGTTYYWRVQVVEGSSGITGAYSTTRTFTTLVVIDLTRANYQRFVNISSWPITDTIVEVDQDGSPFANPGGYMCINHTKRGIWPTSDFFGDPGTQVESNQWYFAFIGGTWYAGSGENMRPNQICKQGQMSEAIGPDGTWGGPMDTWAPRAGELVGYMMTTPARFWPAMKTVDERSNVIVQPWVDSRFSSTSSIRK